MDPALPHRWSCSGPHATCSDLGATACEQPAIRSRGIDCQAPSVHWSRRSRPPWLSTPMIGGSRRSARACLSGRYRAWYPVAPGHQTFTLDHHKDLWYGSWVGTDGPTRLEVSDVDMGLIRDCGRRKLVHQNTATVVGLHLTTGQREHTHLSSSAHRDALRRSVSALAHIVALLLFRPRWRLAAPASAVAGMPAGGSAQACSASSIG